MAKRIALLVLGALVFSGCAFMMKTDPGAIEGLEFGGYPGKAGKSDIAIVVSTMSVNLFEWHISSGDITWDEERETVNGWPTLTDCCTQDKFMELMETLARHYNADIIQYQYDDYEPFNVGSAPTDWVNVPFWLAYWFFPTREVDCSAVLRMRPEVAEEPAAEEDSAEEEVAEEVAR